MKENYMSVMQGGYNMNIRCNLMFMFFKDRGIDFNVAQITYWRWVTFFFPVFFFCHDTVIFLVYCRNDLFHATCDLFTTPVICLFIQVHNLSIYRIIIIYLWMVGIHHHHTTSLQQQVQNNYRFIRRPQTVQYIILCWYID